MHYLLFLFTALLAAGLFFILTGALKIPTMKKAKDMLTVGKTGNWKIDDSGY